MSSISVTQRSVTINNLEIDNEETVNIMNDVEENDLEKYVINSINIGSSVLRNQITTEKIDYVEKEFKGLLSTLDKKTEEWEELIIEAMDESLDPEKEGKPINTLRNRLLYELGEIRKDISKEKGIVETEEYGTRKGKWFEEDIEMNLSQVKSINDSVEQVGELAVEGSRRKVGDVLITVNEPEIPEFKMIVEVKAGSDFSLTGKNPLKKQLSDSMALRGAKAGIAIIKQKNTKGRQKIWEEEGSNRLIVAVDVDDLENRYDYTMLEVAYTVMRNRIIQSFGSSEIDIPDVDAVAVENLVKEISESLEVVKGLQNNCSTVITSVNEIQKKIADLRANIDSLVVQIRALLK
jgi:hypothetical protein